VFYHSRTCSTTQFHQSQPPSETPIHFPLPAPTYHSPACTPFAWVHQGYNSSSTIHATPAPCRRGHVLGAVTSGTTNIAPLPSSILPGSVPLSSGPQNLEIILFLRLYTWWAVTTSSHADMAIIMTKEVERVKEHMGMDNSSAASAISSKHAT
jgi:hypothetical protein